MTREKARRTYGEGSVYQRSSDGRWVGTLDVGFTDNGKRKRITVTGKSEAEAARKLTKKRTERDRAEQNASAPDAGRKTVHAWGVEWLELRRDNVRPKTYERSELMLRRYVDPTIGRKRLVDLSARDVRLVDAKVRATSSEDNVRAIRYSLMAMLRDAIGEGYSVPAALFEASKSKGEAAKVTGPKRTALEVPQAVAVLAQAATTEHYARWVAGFYQGVRQGETLGLTWDAIDFDRGLVTWQWQLQPLKYEHGCDGAPGSPTCGLKKAGACPDRQFIMPRGYEVRRLEGRFHLVRPKTQAGWRVAPMTEDFHDALLAWRDVAPENPHGLVWVRGNGWPIDKADDAETFRDLQRAAGVRKGEVVKDGKPVDLLYTGHEMRNTCATILTLAGVDPATITAILGHSSWSTSLSYVTSQLDHMRAALKSVNAAYKPRELG